jgi:hypothetical protein
MLPWNKIDPTLTEGQMCLNLTNFTTPDLSIAQNEISFRGHAVPVPGKVRDEDRTLTFNYMLSHDWFQYGLLYKWFNIISTEDGASGTNDDRDYRLDLTVLQISEFKQPIFAMKFVGAYISRISSIDLDYQTAGENIQHSFDVKYAYYTFENLIDDCGIAGIDF